MSELGPLRSLAPPALAGVVRALGATWRVHADEPPQVAAARARGPVLYCFWHGEQLPLAWLHRDQGVVGMASLSTDGEVLARVVTRLGYGTLRGSSSRGGSQALRAGIRLVREEGRSLALAVDGPRGPFHQPHPGAAALSAATGAPLVLVASRSRGALRLRSWDRFVIPGPFARLEVAYGLQEPPPSRSRQALAEATEALRQGLEALAPDPERPERP